MKRLVILAVLSASVCIGCVVLMIALTSCAASDAYHPQHVCHPAEYGCTNPFGPVPTWIGPDGGVRYR